MQADYGQTPTLYTITVTTQDVEYSQLIEKQVKAIRVQCRDGTDIRVAFQTGKVAGSTDPYHTVKSGTVLYMDRLFWNNPTIYVAAAAGTKKVEVLVWE